MLHVPAGPPNGGQSTQALDPIADFNTKRAARGHEEHIGATLSEWETICDLCQWALDHGYPEQDKGRKAFYPNIYIPFAGSIDTNWRHKFGRIRFRSKEAMDESTKNYHTGGS